jgi:hypothetical protein
MKESAVRDPVERQERFWNVLENLMPKLREIDQDGAGVLHLDREQVEALQDCIALVEAIRIVTVNVR